MSGLSIQITAPRISFTESDNDPYVSQHVIRTLSHTINRIPLINFKATNSVRKRGSSGLTLRNFGFTDVIEIYMLLHRSP